MAPSSFQTPIIVKKVKKVTHASHGGAWKIAYADFVTAMMAFFLLLWLISMTTPEQKKGLADYFAPASVSETQSGAGGVLAGRSFDTSGSRTTDAVSDKMPGVAKAMDSKRMDTLEDGAGEQGVTSDNSDPKRSAYDKNLKSKYDDDFKGAAASIRQAWQALPDLTDIADNLRIDETPDGLDIVIMDEAGRPMFPEGSKYPFEKTRQAIAVLAPILQRLPNQIRIAGHTASGGAYSNPRYGAWELSSDRANETRVILGEFGLSDDRIDSVIGRATSQPLLPDDPYLSANERVEITLLHALPPVPASLKF